MPERCQLPRLELKSCARCFRLSGLHDDVTLAGASFAFTRDATISGFDCMSPCRLLL
jgi:hypothetical protein